MITIQFETKKTKDSERAYDTTLIITDFPETTPATVAFHALRNMVVLYQNKLRKLIDTKDFVSSKWTGRQERCLDDFAPSNKGEKRVKASIATTIENVDKMSDEQMTELLKKIQAVQAQNSN